MPKDGRTLQLVDLLGKKKTLPPSVSRGAILILAFLCKAGTLSPPAQKYSVTVPRHVSVQRGLSVHISCQFTYDQKYYNRRNEIFGYWFKLDETVQHCLKQDSFCPQGRLMATNDYRQSVETSAMDRFYLTGDPKQRSCSFLIVNAQLEDAGQYFFRIQGGWTFRHSYSNSSQVSVTEKPRDIQVMVAISRRQQHVSRLQKKEGDLEPVAVQEGDSINLLCQASGTPDPVLTWRNQNKTFAESLPLAQVGPEAAGEYECQAVNVLGSARITVQLLVQYSPRTMTFSVSRASRKNQTLTRDAPQEVAEGSQLTAEEGSSLWLLCKVDSDPPAKTHWTKEGRTLESFPYSWLELTNLTVADEGEYTCQAENFLGSIRGTFHLYVAYAPKVSQNSLRNTTCWYKDQGFVCDCSLLSKPGPEIQWQVDGEVISGSSSDSSWQVTSLVQEEEVTSSLNWTGSLETDHRITCTGKNAFGVCTVQFLLSSLKKCTTGRPVPWFVSGVFGGWLAASLVLLGLWLLRFHNQKKPRSKASSISSVDLTNGEHQRANNHSLIYGNILPVAPRTRLIGPSKAAEERSPKPGPVRRIPSPRAADPEQLHYASLAFNLKSGEVPRPDEESTEYSAVK